MMIHQDSRPDLAVPCALSKCGFAPRSSLVACPGGHHRTSNVGLCPDLALVTRYDSHRPFLHVRPPRRCSPRLQDLKARRLHRKPPALLAPEQHRGVVQLRPAVARGVLQEVVDAKHKQAARDDPVARNGRKKIRQFFLGDIIQDLD